MLTARAAFCADVSGDSGGLYAFGGVDGLLTLASGELYLPDAGTWSAIAPMPSPRASMACAVGTDGTIYALGGAGGNGTGTEQIFSVAEAYEPTAKTWTELPPLPQAVSGAAAALGADGRIYVIGGQTTYKSASAVPTVQAYSPGTKTWTFVAPLPGPRTDLAAAEGPDGRIYAFGGDDGQGRLDTVVALDSLPQ